MYQRLFVICALLVGWASSANGADLSQLPAGVYQLDRQHAYITFSYTHLGFSNPYLRFRDFDVAFELNPSAPEQSKIGVTIQAASIDSGVDEFDDHLKDEQFFNVSSYPEIQFTATKIELSSEDEGTLHGELSMKGITKPVSLDVKLNAAGDHPIARKPSLGFSARTTLKRSDWNMGAYAPAVSDEVSLIVEVELNKQ